MPGGVGFPRSELEQIGDRLRQAEAILAYEGALTRRLIAVRELLSRSDSTALPSPNTRKLWADILETMLRLDMMVPAAGEVADLLRQIESLRRAVRAHEADIGR